MDRAYRNKAVIASLVVPGLLTFVFAVLAPICLSVYYGFTEFSGLGTPRLIGFANYAEMLKDRILFTSLRNSLLLAAGFVFIQHPLAMLTAVILDKLGKRGEGVFRTVYFLPNVISVAIIAYLWRFIYNPSFGLLNNVIKMLGGEGNTNWLGSGNAIWSVLITLIWHGFGWGMLIYYTGIKNIDPTLYEAALIDGADNRQVFFRITLPQMKPVIEVNVTLALIAALKQMETVYLLTDGGPANETQFMANYLYKQAFRAYRYGYGNAISVVFVIVCVVATQMLNRAFREREATL